jgi:FKBP-type peptidyl-prolyl cis-trans isomerase 2
MAVKDGDTVKVHYTGKLDDGTVFDSSNGREPLEFKVGEHKVIKGFEEGMIGMEVGQEKTIDIPADSAYGQRNEQLMQEVPKTMFKDFTPEVGQQIGMMTQEGQPLQAKVLEVGEEKVKLDLNHPLAGKNLHFTVKLESVA